MLQKKAIHSFIHSFILHVRKHEVRTSLSVTEGVAASGAVTLSGVQFVLGPEEEAAWAETGVETAATGALLSKPCWLSILDMDD